MKAKAKYLLAAAGLLLISLAAAVVIARGGMEVETVAVSKGDITRVVEDTGYVQPAQDFVFYATQSSRITELPVETGDSVEKGQPLVIMENLDLSLQISDTRSRLSQANAAVSGARSALDQAELAYADAQRNLARIKELYQAGAVPQVDYDQAVTQEKTRLSTLTEQRELLAGALNQVDLLNQQISQFKAKENQLVINSPAAGIVLNLPVKEKQVVAPGEPLVTVALPDLLEVKADLLSDDLAGVEVGQPVVITAPVLGGKAIKGTVKKIYPRAEEKQSALGVIQRRVPVIISLTETAGLKPGYEVTAAVEIDKKQNVLLLPREAVRTMEDGKQEVMLVTGGRVSWKVVSTGFNDSDNVEISSGLKEGEIVVRDATLNLAENTRVKGKGKTSSQ